MKFKRVLVVALATAAFLAVGALAFAADTIKIAVAAPLTGAAAAYGDNIKAGVMLKVEEINAKGGIGGKKVEAVMFDEQCEPKEAQTVSTKIALDKDIVGVIGHVCSSAHLAALPSYLKEGVVAISPTATNVKISENNAKDGKVYGFRNVFRDDAQGMFLADYASKMLGVKKVAVFFENNDYGIGLKDAFVKQAKAVGMTVVAEEGYQSKAQDFKPQLTKVKVLQPEAIFISGYFNEGALIAQQAKGMGLDVIKLGGEGLDNMDYIKLAGAAAEKTYITTPFLAEVAGPAAQAFIAKFKDVYKRDVDYMSVNAYDATGMLLEAVAKAGTDRAKVRDALAAMNSKETAFKGISGLNYFDAKGDSSKPLFVKMVKDGKFVPADKQMN